MRHINKMNIEVEKLQVIHNTDANRFEIRVDGHLAELDYLRTGSVITFTHTAVPSALEGQGIGSKLVRAGLDYARENGLRVISLCWFVTRYMRRKPEYGDLVNR
jgi:predicted GNAT family acetyltransferase